MKRICVFCGSSTGVHPDYVTAAQSMGRLLAGRGIALVYGGGCVGLMGALADAALGSGGQVVGVIPRALWKREVGHTGLSDLRVVETMHQRKALMAELADGFVALPGGVGTLEELFEMWTWAQLGMHRKPCGLLNVSGYYTPLLDFVGRMVNEQFLKDRYRSMLLVENDPALLLQRFEEYQPLAVEQWISEEMT